MFLNSFFSGAISFFFKEVLSKRLTIGKLFPRDYADKLSKELIYKKYIQILTSNGKEVPTGKNIEHKLVALSNEYRVDVNLLYHPFYILSGIYTRIDDEARLDYKEKVLSKLQREMNKYLGNGPDDPNTSINFKLGNQFLYLSNNKTKEKNPNDTENSLSSNKPIMCFIDGIDGGSIRLLDYIKLRSEIQFLDVISIDAETEEIFFPVMLKETLKTNLIESEIIDSRKEKLYQQLFADIKDFPKSSRYKWMNVINSSQKESLDNNNQIEFNAVTILDCSSSTKNYDLENINLMDFFEKERVSDNEKGCIISSSLYVSIKQNLPIFEEHMSIRGIQINDTYSMFINDNLDDKKLYGALEFTPSKMKKTVLLIQYKKSKENILESGYRNIIDKLQNEKLKIKQSLDKSVKGVLLNDFEMHKESSQKKIDNNGKSNVFILSHTRKKRYRSILEDSNRFIFVEVFKLTSVFTCAYILRETLINLDYIFISIVVWRGIHLLKDSYFKDLKFFYWDKHVLRERFSIERRISEIKENLDINKRKEHLTFISLVTKEKISKRSLINRKSNNHIVFKSSNSFVILITLFIYLDFFMRLDKGKVYISNRFLGNLIKYLNEDIDIYDK